MLPAFLIVISLIAIGILLQWLPYGTPILKIFEDRYRCVYVVLLVREKPEYAGTTNLSEALRHIEPEDVLDSLYVVDPPIYGFWNLSAEAKDYFNDSYELREPSGRTETACRLFVFAGSIKDLPPINKTSGYSLLRLIATIPKGKRSTSMARWFPRMSSPAISMQEGAEAFGYLLAKTV